MATTVKPPPLPAPEFVPPPLPGAETVTGGEAPLTWPPGEQPPGYVAPEPEAPPTE